MMIMRYPLRAMGTGVDKRKWAAGREYGCDDVMSYMIMAVARSP